LEALSRHPVVRKLTDKVRESLGLTFLFVTPEARVVGIQPGHFMPATNGLCARVCTDRKRGMKLCLSAASGLLSTPAFSPGGFLQKPCHLGLQTLGAPIVVDGTMLGLIATCGFLRAEHVFDEEQAVAHRAARQAWAPGLDEALASLRATPSLTVREVRFTADLMALLVEQLIHFSRASEADAEALQRAWFAVEMACPRAPLVGAGSGLRAVAAVVERSASKRLPTLVSGPPGAGHSHLARHLHRRGGFLRSPFVQVEAREGLSVVKGLAKKKRFGLTVVVDHLEQASPAVQLELAALVRDHPDVFWVSTARGPLLEPVVSSVGVVQLALPPLVERRADVEDLVTHLLATMGSVAPVPGPVMSALERYSWPGNVAELEAVLRRALALGGLSLNHLPHEVAVLSLTRRRTAGFHEEVQQFKSELVSETLARTSGNVSQAARELGLQRTYLHRLIKELGVQPPRERQPEAPAPTARQRPG
ncbi:MAG: PocR ligand-binding domain-containing protein, partial [Myxococcaceae bacterium]|nr:PocR ligand-binding domain-containing protein [Myxococcaceae bacterium]